MTLEYIAILGTLPSHLSELADVAKPATNIWVGTLRHFRRTGKKQHHLNYDHGQNPDFKLTRVGKCAIVSHHTTK